MSLIHLLALFCVLLPQVKSDIDCSVCQCLFNMFQCTFTQETEIPPVLPNYVTTFVTRITFLNSGIRVLKKDNFINFPNLVSIVIQNSQLNEIEEGAFNGVASNLASIDFTGNKLNMINPRWFLDMTSLRELVLTNNRIEFIPPNSFAELTELTQLHIDANLIKRISIGNLNVLNSSSLTDVKLGSNPFVCDCYLVWLQQALVDMSMKFLDSEQMTCEYPSNVTGEQVSEASLISTYCLNLCLAVTCTENSSCTILENNFPTCACKSGFDPIGNGTYDCTPADKPSSTLPVPSPSSIIPVPISSSIIPVPNSSSIIPIPNSSSIIPVPNSSSIIPVPISLYSTDTNIHLPSTSLQSLMNTSVPKVSTTHVPTQSTISVHITSTTTNTLSSTVNTTTDIPTQSTISVYSTSTSTTTNTLSPTTFIPTQSTISVQNPSLITIVSSLSSHFITPSMIPNNTNNFQANLLIPLSLTSIAVFIVCFIAFVVAWRIKKRKVARADQAIEMTVIGHNNNYPIEESIDPSDVIRNPVFLDLEAPSTQLEDQISPT